MTQDKTLVETLRNIAKYNHPKTEWNEVFTTVADAIESTAAQLAAKSAECEKYLEVLKGYEAWEADVLMDEFAWADCVEFPVMNERIWGMLEQLQHKRNVAMYGTPYPTTETQERE